MSSLNLVLVGAVTVMLFFSLSKLLVMNNPPIQLKAWKQHIDRYRILIYCGIFVLGVLLYVACTWMRVSEVRCRSGYLCRIDENGMTCTSVCRND